MATTKATGTRTPRKAAAANVPVSPAPAGDPNAQGMYVTPDMLNAFISAAVSQAVQQVSGQAGTGQPGRTEPLLRFGQELRLVFKGKSRKGGHYNYELLSDGIILSASIKVQDHDEALRLDGTVFKLTISK